MGSKEILIAKLTSKLGREPTADEIKKACELLKAKKNAAASEALECPVCLELPEGEVHQCNEGHCYCAECWNRLEEPRRCPECRQPVPQANRNRAAERAIAALEWSCEHCGEATTRGAKAAHLAACPQVPTACAAAAAGCGWAGVRVEQAAHEAACPFAICLRMMAPLQAECLELRACVTLQQSECQELRAHNQELQVRMRALEDGSAGPSFSAGPSAGPVPHPEPPSDDAAAVAVMAERVPVVARVLEASDQLERQVAALSLWSAAWAGVAPLEGDVSDDEADGWRGF